MIAGSGSATTINGYTDAGVAHVGVLFDSVINNRIITLNAQMTGGYAPAGANRHAAVGITRITNPATVIVANVVCACSTNIASSVSQIHY